MHPTTSSTTSTEQVSLAIGGMSCGHCVAAVTEALAGLPGVEVRQVAVGSASVGLDPRVTSRDRLVDAIREAGYEARVAARPLPQASGAGCCSSRPA